MAVNKMMLAALEYPGIESFDSSKPTEFRKLMVWLENMKIRFYKLEQRKPLQSLNHPAWDDHFRKYLTLMDCPMKFDPKNPDSMVGWMLQASTRFDYQDSGKVLNSFARDLAVSHGKEKPPEPFKDVGSDDVPELLTKICKALKLKIASESMVDKANAIRACLTSEILPALAYSKKGGFKIEDFPLGFTTGDKAVDKAATLLRMLFVKDVRQLQSLIDRTIVKAQEYTANPKTDSRLGRVGR
ncbi:hypothetical protein BSKO_11254 [Bryopsis sp. KO-2023]|nr:hypothetical protein BSKO_11254 [Bryopsis sp. KO-2023]